MFVQSCDMREHSNWLRGLAKGCRTQPDKVAFLVIGTDISKKKKMLGVKVVTILYNWAYFKDIPSKHTT